MVRPRILLADDHLGLLKAMRVVTSEMGEVVGAVTDGRTLVQAAQRLKPDIIVADISMPEMNGLDATRALRAYVPETKVIILSSHREPAYVTMAFDAGACGYILKQAALYAELSQALLHVLAGDRYIGLEVRGEWGRDDSAFTSGPGRSERPSMR